MQRAFILNDLFVAQDARKQGVAHALIEQCYSYCEENNARYITLETAETNISAQKLYEKMDMEMDLSVRHYSKYF